MFTGIDHVFFAVPDLDEAAVELEGGLGIRVGPGGRHEAWGTLNRLSWFGDTYLELVAVEDRERAATSWFGQAVLEALAASPNGGFVGFVLASDDLHVDVADLRWVGPGFGGLVGGSRERPDGRIVRWDTARPPGAESHRPLAFAIEHDPSAAEWTPEERAARAAEIHPLGATVRLVRLELAVRDVPIVIDRLLRWFDLRFRPSLSGGGARDAEVGGQTVRLRRLAPGVPAATVVLRSAAATGERTLDLAGCRFLVGG
ncbi:MAG: VOC family protein [Candidatus Limnocylindrales bacterium]